MPDVKARIFSRRARLVAAALVSCHAPASTSAPRTTVEVPAPTATAPAPTTAPEPVTDRDGDGIEDASDACPDIAGPDRGCPARPCLSIITPGKPTILARVAFPSASAAPLPSSSPVLDEIARTLADHAQLRVRIDGHTDATEPAPLGLTRAQAVRTALIKRGIDASRLDVSGLAASRPRASNATATGREENRRVEFEVLE